MRAAGALSDNNITTEEAPTTLTLALRRELLRRLMIRYIIYQLLENLEEGY